MKIKHTSKYVLTYEFEWEEEAMRSEWIKDQDIKDNFDFPKKIEALLQEALIGEIGKNVDVEETKGGFSRNEMKFETLINSTTKE